MHSYFTTPHSCPWWLVRYAFLIFFCLKLEYEYFNRKKNVSRIGFSLIIGMYFPALIIGRITECSIVFHRGLYFGLLQAMVSVIVFFRPEVLCDVLMLSRVLLHVEWRPSTHIPSKKLLNNFVLFRKIFSCFCFLVIGLGFLRFSVFNRKHLINCGLHFRLRQIRMRRI